MLVWILSRCSSFLPHLPKTFFFSSVVGAEYQGLEDLRSASVDHSLHNSFLFVSSATMSWVLAVSVQSLLSSRHCCVSVSFLFPHSRFKWVSVKGNLQAVPAATLLYLGPSALYALHRKLSLSQNALFVFCLLVFRFVLLHCSSLHWPTWMFFCFFKTDVCSPAPLLFLTVFC